jgi:hypothetical protein
MELPGTLTLWLDALRASTLVRVVFKDNSNQPPQSDQGQPLVLSGTPAAPLLYLRRYWLQEQQLALALWQRAAQHSAVDEAAARQWLDRLFDPVAASAQPATSAPSLGPKGAAAAAPDAATADTMDWQKMACAVALGGRVKRFSFGAGDYTLDLGMSWDLAETVLEPARAQMVLHSRAAGLEAPIDTVWIELREMEAFRASCARGVALGFQGRLCIHPDQVPIANAAYSPPEAEVARAHRIVAAFAEAEAAGLASIQVEGRFVDYPIVERAQRVIALAERIGLTIRA